MKDKALAVVDGIKLTEKKFIDSIDGEIEHLYDTGDIVRATELVNRLDSLDTVSGHAKAKFLYGFMEWWRNNRPEENFGDHIESTTTTKAVTVKRYVQVWKYVDDYTIPQEIAERPMRELVPIASHLAQGNTLSKEQWRKIKLSTTSGQISEILREAKGKPARKSARVIKMERDGSLYGYKDKQKYFIGFLNIKEAENDIVLAEFIEKIKTSAGVLED